METAYPKLNPALDEAYDVRQTLSISQHSAVVRALRRRDGLDCVLKIPRPARDHTASPAARCRHEQTILERIDSPRVVRGYGLDQVGGDAALVLQPLPGRSLTAILSEGPLETPAALRLLLELVEALRDIHAAGVVYNALQPAHVIVDATLRAPVLVDFRAASLLSRELRLASSAGLSGHALAYTSPERTGRTHRTVDYRSDLYALGCLAHALLTGSPPFDQGDRAALIYAHIALPPPPLPAAPALARVVGRLLAKRPDDRYQTLDAVRHDLRRCLEGLESTGRLPDFAVGATDRPSRLRSPGRLHGRDAELAQLQAGLDRAASGQTRLLLVHGPAGIGKSALVRHACSAFAASTRVGYGKFELLDRAQPYVALSQALATIVAPLLAAPDAELETARARIQAALAPNAALLFELIPELEWLLGPQPAVPPAQGLEARERFDQTIRALLSAIGEPGAAAIVFLDDLQWADAATLNTLTAFLTQPVGQAHLVLIGTYRSNEVDPQHPLTAMTQALAQAGVQSEQLALAPLELGDLVELVADCTQSASGHDALARRIHRASGGLPLVARELLTTAYEAGQISFDAARARWDVDPAAAADDADPAAVHARRLERLDPRQRELLGRAACLGHRFDPEVVARSLGAAPHALLPAFDALVSQRLLVAIRPDGRGALRLQFDHDKVHEAAYALVKDPSRIHLDLGRALLAAEPDPSAPGDLFEIVRHLHLARPHLTADERRQLVGLSELAGLRALRGAAYAAAVQHLRRARQLRDPGEPRPFEPTRALAEALYLEGGFDEARRFFRSALDEAQTPVERARIHRTRLILETHNGDYPRAIEIALEGLAELGLRLAPKPSPATVLKALARSRLAVARSDVARLPDMRDPRLHAQIDLLLAASSAVYQSGSSELLAVTAFEAARLTAEHGLTSASGFALAYYGMLLQTVGQAAAGRQIAARGLALYDGRLHDPEMSCRAHLVYAAYVQCWTSPPAEIVPVLERSYAQGIASGNQIFAGYALYWLAFFELHGGAPLDQVRQACERADAYQRRIQDPAVALYTQAVERVAGALQGDLSEPEVLRLGFLPAHVDGLIGTLRLSWWLHRLILAFFLRRDAEAVHAAKHAAKHLSFGAASLLVPLYTLYAGLTACRAYPGASAAARLRTRVQLTQARRRFRGWAHENPALFEAPVICSRAPGSTPADCTSRPAAPSTRPPSPPTSAASATTAPSPSSSAPRPPPPSPTPRPAPATPPPATRTKPGAPSPAPANSTPSARPPRRARTACPRRPPPTPSTSTPSSTPPRRSPAASSSTTSSRASSGSSPPTPAPSAPCSS